MWSLEHCDLRIEQATSVDYKAVGAEYMAAEPDHMAFAVPDIAFAMVSGRPSCIDNLLTCDIGPYGCIDPTGIMEGYIGCGGGPKGGCG